MKKTIIALATGCMLSTTLLASPAHAWGFNNNNNCNTYNGVPINTGWRGTVNRFGDRWLGYTPFNGSINPYANYGNYNWGNTRYGYNYGYGSDFTNPYLNTYGGTGVVGRLLNKIF